jgi:hypothetical protein
LLFHQKVNPFDNLKQNQFKQTIKQTNKQTS